MTFLGFLFLIVLITLYDTIAANSCKGYRANPAVYNFEIGGRPAKVISDGRLLFEAGDAYDEPPYIVRRAFRKNYQSDSPIVFENNVMYLDLGEKKVLFDTGNSFLWDPKYAGFLFKNLEAEGIDRDSITDIFINHAHFDDIGGILLPDGETIAFPNAMVHISEAEWNFWLQDEVPLDKNVLPQANKDFLISSAKKVLPKIPESKRDLFQMNATYFDGMITVEPTVFHTPGHVSFMIEINGEKLLYAGDAIGIESTSINNPWFRLKFDTDMDEAALGRVKFLEKIADTNLTVITYHGSFPGMGKIVTNDLTFDFKPVNWEFQPGVETKCSA